MRGGRSGTHLRVSRPLGERLMDGEILPSAQAASWDAASQNRITEPAIRIQGAHGSRTRCRVLSERDLHHIGGRVLAKSVRSRARCGRGCSTPDHLPAVLIVNVRLMAAAVREAGRNRRALSGRKVDYTPHPGTRARVRRARRSSLPLGTDPGGPHRASQARGSPPGRRANRLPGRGRGCPPVPQPGSGHPHKDFDKGVRHSGSGDRQSKGRPGRGRHRPGLRPSPRRQDGRAGDGSGA